MWCFRNKKAHKLELEVSGLRFSHPVGIRYPETGTPASCARSLGFVTLTPPQEDILSWITRLQGVQAADTRIFVNLSADVRRTFALTYDFADILVIDPDPSGGISSPDVSDITSLLDDLLSLRLCYEKLTPVYLRIPKGVTQDELEPLLNYCQLSGVDGIIAPSVRIVRDVVSKSLGRMPVAGTADDVEVAREMLSSGASLVEITCARPLPVLKLLKKLEKEI